VELVHTSLLTPMVLAFVAGAPAARAGRDLKLPDAIDSEGSRVEDCAIAAFAEDVSGVREDKPV